MEIALLKHSEELLTFYDYSRGCLVKVPFHRILYSTEIYPAPYTQTL